MSSSTQTPRDITFADDRTHSFSGGPVADEPTVTITRVAVSAIMSAPVRCATPDMSLDELDALLSEHGLAVPVVDAQGKPIGMVGRPVSSVAHSMAPALPVQVKVRDVMTHGVFSTGADASVTQVAALMAYEQLHHILVVDQDGRMLGIVSSLDIARWLAHCDGYVVPKRSGT